MTIQTLRNQIIRKVQEHAEDKKLQKSFLAGMSEVMLSGPFYKELNIDNVRHALTAAAADLKITLSFGLLPIATKQIVRNHPMMSYQEEVERKGRRG